MTLKEYYKQRVYEYGYDRGWLDRNKGIERPNRDISGDIFYQDEEDYYIIADYIANYGMTDEDKKFLAVLEYEEKDFYKD